MSARVTTEAFINGVNHWIFRLSSEGLDFNQEVNAFLEAVPGLLQQYNQLISLHVSIEQEGSIHKARELLHTSLELLRRTDLENAGPSKEFPSLDDLYNSLEVRIIEAAGGLTLKGAGALKGCSHFAAAFLEESRDKTLGSKDLAALLFCKDLSVPKSLNGAYENQDLAEVVLNRPKLQLIDENGRETEEPQYRTIKNLEETAQILQQIASYSGIQGFLLATATETFGVRLRETSIEFFDSQGDPSFQEPAYVADFERSVYGFMAIAQFIHYRIGAMFQLSQYYCQLTIAPVTYKTE